MKRTSFLTIAFLLSGILLSPSILSQQKKITNKEIDSYIKTWREKIARYLITKEEQKIFKKLKTREEKLQFIKFFWDRRDPNPKTPRNEFREEILRRIAYTDKAFRIGKRPGWKTPMGHLYIVFGPPSEVQQGMTADLRKYLAWTYYRTPGDVLPMHYTVVFIDYSGNGDYRVADLSYMGEMYSHWVSEQIHNPAGSPYLPPTLINAIEKIKKKMIVNKEMKFEPSKGKLREKRTLTKGSLPFVLRVDYFLGLDGKTDVLFWAGFRVKDLLYEEKGKTLSPKIEIEASLSGEGGAKTKKDISFKIDKEEIKKIPEERLPFFVVLSVPPGEYTMDFSACDLISGGKGAIERKLTIPDLTNKGLRMSKVILAEGVRRGSAEDKNGVNLGGYQVFPLKGGILKRDAPLTIFFQLIGLSLDDKTKKNSVTISYSFYKDGELALSLPSSAVTSTDSSTLFVIETIPAYAFSPGDYQLIIGVEDMIAKKSFFSSRIPFIVIE